jgi:membrane protein implicated in regulation of membrane protease activity
MTTLFLYCAAIGGTILVLQFLMLLLGVGGDHSLEGDVGHDQSSFLKLFSLQAICTFATFFGLVGIGTEGLHWSTSAVVGAATLAGAAALWFVAKVMRGLSRMHSDGNVDLRNAIGHAANVYLHVPPPGQGHGRVLVIVQGRTVECAAVSTAAAIPTGAEVRVVECRDDETLVVEPLP